MRVIVLPLLLLLMASCLGVCRALGFIEFSGDPMGSSFYNGSDYSYDANGTLISNGTSTTVTGETASVGLSGVISSGVISLVVAGVALAIVSSIRVLGTGMGDVGVSALWQSATYFGVWALFSVLALLMFAEIPVFGMPLYFLLTFFYAIGVLGQITE